MGRRVCYGQRKKIVFALLGAAAVSMLTHRIQLQDYDTSITDKSQFSVNETWLERRKNLLSTPGHVTKVIIFAYMRGGSSIIGDTFGNDDAAWYWYEPLDQFYNDYFGYKIYSIPLHITYTLDGNRRVPGADETESLAKFFDHLYSCRLDQLPMELFVHPFMRSSLKTRHLNKCKKNINSCKVLLPKACSGPGRFLRDSSLAVEHDCNRQIHELRGKPNILNNLTQSSGKADEIKFQKHEQCMRHLISVTKPCIKRHLDISICKNQTMQVSKVLRANMETMEQILHKIPNAYIVHYMRDPRAIAMSVKKVPAISFMAKNNKGVVMTELEMLCKKMKRDIEIRKELEMKYPGAFVTLKYEDLVNDPQSSVKSVYSSIGRNVPTSLFRFLDKALYNTNAKESSFSHSRRNASETSKAWMKKIPSESLVNATEMCRDVLLEMGILK